ncbi:hypothetical protein [[Phormidium] sp. ETS-05]|nr:hypothetical protein [[Phormidium] sp. ETS-05]
MPTLPGLDEKRFPRLSFASRAEGRSLSRENELLTTSVIGRVR